MLNSLVTLAGGKKKERKKERKGKENPPYFQITTTGILKIIYILSRESLYT